jgi:predicted dehydrogenase
MRVGVVGCGYWGSKHVRVLDSAAGVDRAVIIEPDDERRADLSMKFPRAGSAATLKEGLEQVDAVVIATPARTHAALARIAMEAGKHVLVEKPMATSTADAVDLGRLAADQGTTLMVGHTFEHHAAVHALKDVITRGSLGDLRYLSSARLNLGLYQPDVNVIWDLAPHDVSIINFLLDSVPRSVDCWAWAHTAGQNEDVAYINLEYGAARAQIHVSWLDPYKVRRMTAVGSERMAVYDDLDADNPVQVLDKRVHSAEGGGAIRYHDGEIDSPDVDMREPLLVEVEHFVECAHTGASPSTDARKGLAVTAVLEAAERSLRERRTVPLDEILHEAGNGGRHELLGLEGALR